jgi:uncharacterized protein with von Willebrand factor type A (vWA) domain
MGLEDCLEPAKALAMAFVQWLTAQHPPQAVFILGFEDAAYPIAPTDLPTASWRSRSPGTNIQHALQLARQLLRPYARGDRQVLLLTDGEPTAHCEDDGHIFFGYPPTWTTIERTLEAAAACAQEGICVYPFLVHTADPWSTRFVIELAAAAHERWFAVAKQQPVAVTLAAYRAAVDTHARA